MAEDIRARFGRRVRKVRLRPGWTQVQLAERLGLDRSYLADVERAKGNICFVNIEIIAKGFRRTLSQLLAGV